MLNFIRRFFVRRFSCEHNGHHILCTISHVAGTNMNNHSHVCEKCGYIQLEETELREDPYQYSMLARTALGPSDKSYLN